MSRILVTGGRDYTDSNWIGITLDFIYLENNIEELIHGGARGTDTLAGEWAKKRNIPVRIFMADWGKYGRAAGFIRNKQMLDEGKPDLVVAFPGGKGTANMIKLAKEANIPVKEIA